MAKDYYHVLGIDKKASAEEVKKAFRKLAQKHHPDKGGDEAKFKEITEAYSVLSDAKRRREYDAYGQSFPGGNPGAGAQGNPFSGSGPSGNPFSGFDFSQFQHAGGGFGQGGAEFDFGDIFGDVFGGRANRARTPRGRDISIDLEIPFKESIFGTTRKVLIAKVSTCELCKGSGAKPGTELETCKTCNGSGRIHETRNSILGQFSTVRPCDACGGTGKVPKEKCPECKGHGTRRREEEITITIPPGIESGEMIRLPQQGEALKGGVAGDLYAKIHVPKHPTFRKEGSNLVMRLPVKLTDALLGAKVAVETLEGKTLEVTLPQMKKTEEILRVRGRGVPLDSRSGQAGDLLIYVEIVLPQKLTNRLKKSLEDLRDEGV